MICPWYLRIVKNVFFFPANWNNWWNLFKQYSIFSLFLFLKAFSDLKYEIDINVNKFENWLISILLTELHNFTADYQIKIARVPLWIGHCHLCIMVYWYRVSNILPGTHSPSTNSPSTHSPSTHPPSTDSPSTHSPLHIRLELIRLVLIRSTHSPNTHSLSTHSPNTHSQY